MKWFKHFTKALTDAKIEKLIMKYGVEGYGLYFACLEIIAGSVSDENITFELEHDAEILAHKFKIDRLKTEEMMRYMIELELFEQNETNRRVTCFKLAQYIDSSLIKNPSLLAIKKNIQADSRKLEIPRENSSQIRLDQIRLDQNINKNHTSVFTDEVNEIYSVYPSKCPIRNRATGKSIKDKEKIKTLLKKITKDEIIETINLYIKDCKRTRTFIQNLSTFLNHFPDKEELIKSSKIISNSQINMEDDLIV